MLLIGRTCSCIAIGFCLALVAALLVIGAAALLAGVLLAGALLEIGMGLFARLAGGLGLVGMASYTHIRALCRVGSGAVVLTEATGVVSVVQEALLCGLMEVLIFGRCRCILVRTGPLVASLMAVGTFLSILLSWTVIMARVGILTRGRLIGMNDLLAAMTWMLIMALPLLGVHISNR